LEDNLKATLEYKKGDVYLCSKSIGGLVKGLVETEILDISAEGRAVKIHSDYGEIWEDIGDFHKTVRAYLGRYKTTGKFLWKKRKLIKADIV
jgi:hypothetical protein